MELNKKLNQKCKAQIIEYLNQTSKIRNAVQMQLIHLSSKNLSNPRIEGKIKNDWNRIEYSRSPRMISIEYLRKIFKKKKIRKRVSLKLPLVPSSLFKSHLEFFTPPRNFFVLGRPQDTHRYEAHKNYNSFLPLLRKERKKIGGETSLVDWFTRAPLNLHSPPLLNNKSANNNEGERGGGEGRGSVLNFA